MLRIDRRAREWYRLGIATTPEVDTWEASFDDGATWVPATQGVEGWGADDFGWLVAGPDAEEGDAVAVITAQVSPMLRATSTPEIVVRNGPAIALIP